ncbi:793_t:CDS:1 [Acaulospora morrowiae]|uniref:793_t:CDS:1 n=1 Tax=Acaulospora morrowiae TaxID=94023 RepID=A0A9N9BNH8_9GLOM|nr:793_t:CDS:1 [Acaulospora morrowiae]
MSIIDQLLSIMVRGDSLVEDLQFLVNNSRYSDLEIKCKDDVILYGNRAILAARCDVFDRMLFTRTEKTPGKQVAFPKIEASTMKHILKYLYTGIRVKNDITTDNAFEILQAADFFQLKSLRDYILEYFKNICEKEDENQVPELLSRAVELEPPLAENGVVDHLIDSMAKVSIDSIRIDRLSLKGLQCLLSKRNEKKLFVSSEYSVIRFAILAAAKQVSQEAFNILEKKLPIWRDIGKLLQSVDKNKNLIEKRISASIVDSLRLVINHIEFRRVDGTILSKLIEPLNIVPKEKIMDSYSFQFSNKSPRSAYYGVPYMWDRNDRGPNLTIDKNGYTVTASTTKHQSVKTVHLMNSGSYEFRVLIEKWCNNLSIGVCGEGIDFSKPAGSQTCGWVLGSDGYCYNNDKYLSVTPSFKRDNVRVNVYLNMNYKKVEVTFSVDGTKYSPITSWNDLPLSLYFVVSLTNPGKIKILSPDE